MARTARVGVHAASIPARTGIARTHVVSPPDNDPEVLERAHRRREEDVSHVIELSKRIDQSLALLDALDIRIPEVLPNSEARVRTHKTLQSERKVLFQ